jgi:hypothetical protein
MISITHTGVEKQACSAELVEEFKDRRASQVQTQETRAVGRLSDSMITGASGAAGSLERK